MDENINKTKRMIKVEPFDENSKRTKTIEKHALDVSNIAEEQKIKKEFKTEVKIEPIDENINEEIEKQALDVSNITGFDYENQTIDKESKIKQEIKQEVKIEPMCKDFNE